MKKLLELRLGIAQWFIGLIQCASVKVPLFAGLNLSKNLGKAGESPVFLSLRHICVVR